MTLEYAIDFGLNFVIKLDLYSLLDEGLNL